MSAKNKIAIIIPYFGKLPVYFNLFLKSCYYNENAIDYLFFTDCPEPRSLPKNLKWKKISLSDFNNLASDKCGRKIQVTKPYKLCDFKPIYGLIFEDYLNEYMFWGHGDEDLILGDVSKFIHPLLLDFDLISVREHWNSGPFMLFRNSIFMNNYFKNSTDWEMAIASKEEVAFDEVYKEWDKYYASNFDVNSLCKQSMTYICKKALENGEIKAHYQTLIKESIEEDNYLIFDKGKIFTKNGHEFLLYHFIIEKKSFQFEFPIWDIIPDKFFIDNTGFFTEEEFANQRESIRNGRIRRGKIRKAKYYVRRVKEKLFLSK